MQILVSGSTGLIGTTLVQSLTQAGHDVVRLVRSKSPSESKELVHWDPQSGRVDTGGLESLDAVVHLAGESVAEGRWTDDKRSRIRDSRVNGTRILCEALAKLNKPPQALLCASATGYYGNRGDEVLTEDSPAGTGFLAGVCRDWEKSCEPAADAGIRVVSMRFGIVLSVTGGALARMLTPFRMGVGGVVGNGRQYMSCISLRDAIGSIEHLLDHAEVSGPVNLVCPAPVTNREFTNLLGRALRRPTFLPLPAFAARLMFAEMADELLLASARVQPAKLLASGCAFKDATVEGALAHMLPR